MTTVDSRPEMAPDRTSPAEPVRAARSRTHLDGLDGLRGLLALWVVGYHVLLLSGVWSRLPSSVQLVFDGGRAVDGFIILSGFVIALLITERQESYGTFIIRRFLRLFPTFAVCVALALTAITLGWMPPNYEPGDGPAHIVAHLTMMHGAIPARLLPNSSGAILNPAWSISLEWQFYLIAPLLLFGRSSYARFATASAACVLLYRFVAPSLSGFDGAFLPFRMNYFWVGISCALAYRAGWLTVRLALAALATGLIFLPYVANVGLLIWLAVLPMVAAEERSVFAWRALCSPVAKWVGQISYPIYLVHEIVIWSVLHFCPWQSIVARALVVAAVALPVAIGMAALLHRFLERPAIELGRRLAQKARGRPQFA